MAKRAPTPTPPRHRPASAKPARLADFHPLLANPNRHTQQGLGQLEAAMDRQGFVAPMTAARNGAILDGNARLEKSATKFPDAAPLVVEHDGRRPVIMVRTDIADEDDPRARDIIVSANRVAEVDLDYDLDVLRQFAADGLDLAAYEFDPKMLASITGETPGLTDPDDVPADRATDIKLGDLFELGAHRLLCGDSTKAEDVARVIGGERAAAMWTDPPYGVSYVGKTKDALKIANDGSDGLSRLLSAAFSGANTALVEGAPIYIARPPGALSVEFGIAFIAAGWHFHEELQWVKDSMVLGHSDYHLQHETIIYGWREGAPRPWFSGRSEKSVFQIARPKASPDHPTGKPVELVIAHIANSTAPAAVVYEPFSGSGTTIIACEQLGRKCRAIEIEPAYVQVAIDRWEQFTGKKATRA